MGLFDDDPVAAARWTHDLFEGDVLEYPDAFRLERPPGWTIRGTAGERYQLRPPSDGPAVDVDIALAPRDQMPVDVGVVEYLRLYLSLDDELADEVVVRSDAFGRRASASWPSGPRHTSAVVLRTPASYVLATTSALAVDAEAVAAGQQVLAALQPLG